MAIVNNFLYVYQRVPFRAPDLSRASKAELRSANHALMAQNSELRKKEVIGVQQQSLPTKKKDEYINSQLNPGAVLDLYGFVHLGGHMRGISCFGGMVLLTMINDDMFLYLELASKLLQGISLALVKR